MVMVWVGGRFCPSLTFGVRVRVLHGGCGEMLVGLCGVCGVCGVGCSGWGDRPKTGELVGLIGGA